MATRNAILTYLAKARPYWAHGILFVFQATALYLFAAPTEIIRGFPLDDAWIHQVVARTFAQTGTLGFSEGQYGAAATSHLWAVILSLNYLVFHAEPWVFTLVINLALSLGTGQLLLVALRRPSHLRPSHLQETAQNESPPEGGNTPRDLSDLLAVGFACAGGNFLWFAYSGMEASLVAFLALAAIVAYGAPGARPERSAWVAGIFAGLLAVTRPECLLFGPALAAATWVLPRKKKDIVFLLIPWALMSGGWLILNLVKTGAAIPPTLAGRRWLWQQGNLGLSRFALLREFAYALVLRLRNYTLGTSATLPFWALTGLSIFGAVRLWRRRSWTLRLILLWGALHLAIYALLLPTPGHGGRYQPLTPLLFLLVGAYGAIYLGQQLAWWTGARSKTGFRLHLHRGLFTVASLAPWVGLASVGVRDWRHDHACAVSHIRWTELGMAEQINELPPAAKVASFDIGGIGFASTRPILDVGGLSDPTTARYMAEGRLWQLFRERGIEYVVLPMPYREDLPDPMNFGRRLRLFDNPALDLELVSYRESPRWIWEPGIGATWNSSPRQALYRIRDTGKPGLDTPIPITGDAHVMFSAPSWFEGPDRDVALYGLRRFSAEGMPVALTVSPVAPAPPGQLRGLWQVLVGPWGVQVLPPSDKPEMNAEVARAAIADLVRPYAEVGDLGGAATIALYGLARFVQRTEPSFVPLMPPVKPPLAGDGDVRTSLGTGFLIMLAVLVSMLAADMGRYGIGPVRQIWRRMRASRRVPLVVLWVLVAVSVAVLGGCEKPSFESLNLGEEAMRQVHGLDPNERNHRGKTPLMVAAERGDGSLVRALLDRGASWDVYDGERKQALHWAIQSGSVAAVRALLDAGAAIESPSGVSALTPLHVAVTRGSLESAELLLRRGANIHAVTGWGEAAVHLLAATDGWRTDEFLPLLVKHGADMGVTDARGFRPLHIAAISDNVHFMRFYVEAGSHLDDPSLLGDTPLDLAISYRRDLAGDFLARNGGSTKKSSHRMPPLHDAVRAGDASRVAFLLAHGADPDKAYDGTSAIELARRGRNEAMVRLLSPAPR